MRLKISLIILFVSLFMVPSTASALPKLDPIRLSSELANLYTKIDIQVKRLEQMKKEMEKMADAAKLKIDQINSASTAQIISEGLEMTRMNEKELLEYLIPSANVCGNMVQAQQEEKISCASANYTNMESVIALAKSGAFTNNRKQAVERITGLVDDVQRGHEYLFYTPEEIASNGKEKSGGSSNDKSRQSSSSSVGAMSSTTPDQKSGGSSSPESSNNEQEEGNEEYQPFVLDAAHLMSSADAFLMLDEKEFRAAEKFVSIIVPSINLSDEDASDMTAIQQVQEFRKQATIMVSRSIFLDQLAYRRSYFQTETGLLDELFGSKLLNLKDQIGIDLAPTAAAQIGIGNLSSPTQLMRDHVVKKLVAAKLQKERFTSSLKREFVLANRVLRQIER